MKVVIDGFVYVPATEVTPVVNDILQALYEGYMGAGRRWQDDNFDVRVGSVNEDGEGDTFEEFAARITEVASRQSQVSEPVEPKPKVVDGVCVDPDCVECNEQA